MNISLHIGSVKTGTTTIQSFLAQHPTWLHRNGWLIPQSLKPHPNFDNHIVLPALFCDDRYAPTLRRIAGQRTKETDRDFRERVNSRFNQETTSARDRGLKQMLISSEHLASRISNIDQLRDLRRWLQPYGNISRIVVYLRRQDELVGSLYSTQIKSGAVTAFEHHPSLHQNLTFNHKKLLQMWLDAFHDAQFIVRPYNPRVFINGDLLDDFFSTLDFPQDRPASSDNKNAALDPEGLAIILAFNRIANIFLHRRTVRPLRERLVRLLAATDSGERLSLSSKEARALLHDFADCNRWLSEMFMNGEPFFNEVIQAHQMRRGLPSLTTTRAIHRLLRRAFHLNAL